MRRIIGLALCMAATSVLCLAGDITTPEIDPASGGAALALLAGGLLVLRARRKK